MTPTVVKTPIFGKAGSQIDGVTSNSDYVIEAAVTILGEMDPLATTDGVPAIRLDYLHHDLTVHGSVIGSIAVRFGDDPGADYGHRLVVSETGLLQGSYAGAMLNGGGSILNEGTIRGMIANGLVQFLQLSATTEIENTGLIVGGGTGIGLIGGEATSSKVVNSGTIIGKDYNALQGLEGTDLVTNTGVLDGDVSLRGGNDRFDNWNGTVVNGSIFGGNGDDIFLPGLGAETIKGGAGVDTLDFRSGGGLKVDLNGGLGTGHAKNDVYSDIERVRGSSTGDDTLIGNGLNNTLMGHGGHDSLAGGSGIDQVEGGSGNDTLAGGVAADSLYGGAGNDSFLLLPSGSDADKVLDWGQVSGNNDRFMLDASVFDAGLSAGAGLGTKFVSRATSNQAVDGVDRFIFRESDETLWFDKDGKGGAAGMMVADLQDGAVVTASDFLLVF